MQDAVCHFASKEEYLRLGRGFAVMKDGRINGEFQRDPELNEEALIAKMV